MKRSDILQEKYENEEFPLEARYIKSAAIDYAKDVFNCSGSYAATIVRQWERDYDITLQPYIRT